MVTLKSFIFPPLAYFAAIKGNDVLCLDVYEHYQKRSLRNKYKILSSQGAIQLSIPLRQGKNNRQSIKDVKIAYDEQWPKKHLQTIKTCYGRSAYFEDYWPYFEHLFKSQEVSLYDFNLKALQLSFKLMQWRITIIESDRYFEDQAYLLPSEKPYPQVFEEKFGFVEGLSIIDLLFTMGPETSLYL